MFAKLPRPMQRTFADDLKWGSSFLAGVTIAYFLIGGDPGLLVGALTGVTITILVLNVARRVSRRQQR